MTEEEIKKLDDVIEEFRKWDGYEDFIKSTSETNAEVIPAEIKIELDALRKYINIVNEGNKLALIIFEKTRDRMDRLEDKANKLKKAINIALFCIVMLGIGIILRSFYE